MRSGVNRLVFHHAWSRRPAEVLGTGDRRPLAVAWYWIDLRRDGTGESGPPRADPADRRLILPAGSRVDYFLDLPTGSELIAERIATRGDARLEMSLRLEGRAEQRLEPVTAGQGVRVQLRTPTIAGLAAEIGRRGRGRPGTPNGSGRLARLRLRATTGSDGGREGAIVLERPRVETALEEQAASAARPAWGGSGSPSAPGSGTSPALPRAGDETPSAGRRAAESPPAGEASPRPPARRPDVVVYLVDTLRSDRLGCYGAVRPDTPRIDGFARGAVLFGHARAQAPWTKPSVASIFTGLWPPEHGTIRFEDRLPATLPILPQLLQRAGYATAAVSANGFVTANFGFDRGFDHFEVLPDPGTRGQAVVERGLHWLDGRRAAADHRPFFLYLHSIDPHGPYDPPPDLRRRWAPGVDPELGSAERLRALSDRRYFPADPAALGRSLGALYDAEVAAADRAFGRFLDGLAARGLADDTLVVFVSDHGEELGEHGRWTHGLDLHREVLAVPLLVQLPGHRHAGRRVERPAEHLDLLPTLLAATGVTPPPGLPGEDLLAPLDDRAGLDDGVGSVAAGDPRSQPRPVFSHLDYFSNRGVSLERGRRKLVLPGGTLGREPRLYDLAADPAERHDLAASQPVRAGWMATEIRRRLAGAAPPAAERGEIDAETRARLRALGYLR